MLISSKRSRSSIRFNGGFTLVELLVSISILLLIISVVVFRFASFDSVILLRTLAYDIGLSIREAQSYSLSALGREVEGETRFRIPYGLSFNDADDLNTYYAFFGYSGSADTPSYEVGDTIDLYRLGRSFVIADVCVDTNDGLDCSVTQLDVSFRRPEYTALFHVPGFSSEQNAAIANGIIKIHSIRNPDVVAVINVSNMGQIEVCVEDGDC